MNRKVSIGVTVAVAAVVAALVLSLTMMISTRNFNKLVADIKVREDEYKKISEIDSVIRENFYYDVDDTTLLNGISNGIMTGLGDTNCHYLTQDEYLALQNRNTGTENSIGVATYADVSGYIRITNVYADSPAQAAEIKTGDLIIAIDDQDVIASGYDTAVASLSGDVGSTVKLKIRRDSTDTEYTLIRKLINIPTVTSRMLDGKIGYVKITEFSDPTFAKFNTAVNTLLNDGATNIIFDLRNNKGGKMSVAAEMLDKLVGSGATIRKTIRGKTDFETLYTSDSSEISISKMVVLVNHSTAAEAETFAATLKDYNKAIIVGTETAGKGVISETYQLTDGSAVILTTGLIVTPLGNTFNETGIKLDSEITLSADEENEFYLLDEITDPQLAGAIDAIAQMNQ